MRTQKAQSRWRAFLTPGWIISALLILVFSYFAFTFLAPWQLGKDHDISERNEQIEAAFDINPTEYHEIFSSGGTIGDNEWYRAVLTGHYLTDSEVLLRMRPAGGGPSYQSLIPFETTDGDIILVNRGFSPIPDGSTPTIDPAPRGEVTITGVARHNEANPRQTPMEADGYKQVYGIHTQQIAALTGINDLSQDYIQLTESQPGVLTPIEIPQLDRGSHLSYGLQWIAFGIMAPFGLIYFIRAELRERRRESEENNEMTGESSDRVNKNPDSGSSDAKDQPRRPRNWLPGLRSMKETGAQVWDDIDPDYRHAPTEEERPTRSAAVQDRYRGTGHKMGR